MFRCSLLFIFANVLIKRSKGVGMLGPVDMIFKRFENCDDPSQNAVDVEITIRKFNRTTNVMDIVVKNSYPIDDTSTLEMKGYVKTEGGYKPGSFYMKDSTCKVLTLLLGDTFESMLNAAGATDGCPLPPGEHKALDYYFDNEKYTVPHMYGEFKTEILMFKEEELKGCYMTYYDMIPKGK